MGAEKKGSKGRLLYLFDWHGKSRKKLFSNKVDLSEGSNEENDYIGNSTVSQYLLRDARVNGNGSMAKRSGSLSTSSSVNEDEPSVARAPSVVARLMGLDSLPTSSASETSSVVSHDPHTLGSSYYSVTPSGYRYKHHPIDYSYMAPRVDELHYYPTDSRSNTVRGRQIERFQTEVLPPKSAKPISITHHRLLSPIKSPGFIPKKDAAYIMEAASRIIESSPQPTVLTRTPSLGAASSPMRIQHLKDKMEAVNRSSSFPDTSKRNRQPSAKQIRTISRDMSNEKPPTQTSMGLEVISYRNSTSKGRRVDLSSQRRDQEGRKDGSTSRSRRNIMQKEKKQVNLKQSSSGQLNGQKSGHARPSANRIAGILKQNTEKINSMSNNDKVEHKASASVQQSRKSYQTDGFVGSCRAVNKVLVNSEDGSKKVVSTTIVAEKRPSLNRMKNISRNKEFVPRGGKVEDSVDDSLFNEKLERAKQHDFGLNAHCHNKRKGMDVISFTFNSPAKKSGASSLPSTETTSCSGRIDSYDTNVQSVSKEPSSPLLRLKLLGGDALSHLLEQKLKELTEKVESAQSDSLKDGIADSASSHLESVSAVSISRDACVGHKRLPKHEQDFPYSESCEREFTGAECCISNTGGISNRDSNHSVSDSSFISNAGGISNRDSNHSVSDSSFNGSCICSSSKHDHNGGKSWCLSYQSEEDVCCKSSDTFLVVDNERDISDTASSTYYEEWDGKHTWAPQSVSHWYSTYWELHYVREIIHLAGLKEFIVDENSLCMNSSVFDQVENQFDPSLTREDAYETSKPERKLLFDCVNDCLCQRYENLSVGSIKAWGRWRVVLQREDWLAEELYKEILGLENMKSLMVDELVEKDMGIQYGGWLDFEIETLEEGMDVGNDLVDSMLDELVTDLCMI